MKTPRAALVGLALAALAAGCSRVDVIQGRINAIPREQARTVLRDAIWRHGSVYAWVEVRSIRAKLSWTEHGPAGDTTRRETWLLDPVGGRVRIDGPEQTILFDGMTWRVLAGGEPVEDLTTRAIAAGRARLVRAILPLPFSLTDEGLTIRYLGAREGPAGARRWHRLLASHGDVTTPDRTVVEFRDETDVATAAVIRWGDLPWAGRAVRIELDRRLATGRLKLAHRWRFYPAGQLGTRGGPREKTVNFERIEINPDLPADAFRRP